jgi:curved DNA-binding protein
MTHLSISEACKVLGIPSTASEEEIQKRWRIVARRHHPDLNPDDPEAKANFKKYRDAYEVLNTFKSGSRAIAALEDEALDVEFDTWLNNLGISEERRAEIKQDLDELSMDDQS